MAKGKNVLTTGDVAKICNVAPRTVSKWFDTGQLKGYRIPGSKDRRIPLNELIRFMKRHNIPSTELAVGVIRLLIVDSDSERATVLADKLQMKNNYEVQAVGSNFETGITASKFSPHVLLINILAKDIDSNDICRNIKSSEELETIKIVALANGLSDSEADALEKRGFDACITAVDDIAGIVKKIEEVTAIIY